MPAIESRKSYWADLTRILEETGCYTHKYIMGLSLPFRFFHRFMKVAGFMMELPKGLRRCIGLTHASLLSILVNMPFEVELSKFVSPFISLFLFISRAGQL